ncbi:alpha-L-fucosidase [Cellulosilyticum sp. I15G10I2]|uniref:alpha-L-fucosidase n=1 Tax=Cellulosilyticum sp. I15G10I2 TaxID=1892843 RepID=UPI00085BC8F8|nr:alpha-L-fucosidase [Cellulosilyticum sp. I15G10I2]
MRKEEYLKEIQEVVDRGLFTDNWDSLGNYQTPKWYRNTKFGIFIHWGVYSMQAFDSEWYSRDMYI